MTLSFHVIVDTITVANGVIPAHGLAILIKVNEKRILFGVGPDLRIFEHNAYLMGLKTEINQVDFIIIPLSLFNFAGALAEFEKKYKVKRIFVPPDFPSGHYVKVFSNLKLNDNIVILGPYGVWRKEIALLIVKRNRGVIFIGCSHRGMLKVLRSCIQDSFKYCKVIDTIVGGLHISINDVLTLDELLSLLRQTNVRNVFPLFCTSIGAREEILKSYKMQYMTGAGFEYVVSGC